MLRTCPRQGGGAGDALPFLAAASLLIGFVSEVRCVTENASNVKIYVNHNIKLSRYPRVVWQRPRAKRWSYVDMEAGPGVVGLGGHASDAVQSRTARSLAPGRPCAPACRDDAGRVCADFQAAGMATERQGPAATLHVTDRRRVSRPVLTGPESIFRIEAHRHRIARKGSAVFRVCSRSCGAFRGQAARARSGNSV